MTTALQQESWQRLLAALDANPEAAGQKYQQLRRRLIFYFEQSCPARADELADEVFNRLAARLAMGEVVVSPPGYAYGIARLLRLEAARQEVRQASAFRAYAGDIQRAADTPDESDLHTAMEACLRRLPAADRRLLLAYYSASGRDLMAVRRRLADALRISAGALRKRVFRLREGLEACVRIRSAREKTRS